MKAMAMIFDTPRRAAPGLQCLRQRVGRYSNVAELTLVDIKAFIAANKWRFARTMSHAPHAYCLKRECSDPQMFEAFVVHIRRHGYRQKFGKAYYTYFDVGRYQYWTLGWPVAQTILINRAIKQKCGQI